jgi:hypothetical protein
MSDKSEAKDTAKPAGGDQLQKAVDKEQEKGFLGFAVDQTPNEHYTVAGVVAGKPTPETDAAAKAAAVVPEAAPLKASKR